jgi:hypothetical protein
MSVNIKIKNYADLHYKDGWTAEAAIKKIRDSRGLICGEIVKDGLSMAPGDIINADGSIYEFVNFQSQHNFQGRFFLIKSLSFFWL